MKQSPSCTCGRPYPLVHAWDCAAWEGCKCHADASLCTVHAPKVKHALQPGDARCPFCDGVYALGASDGRPMVTHSLPPCAPYLRMDADDFFSLAEQTRRAKGGLS